MWFGSNFLSKECFSGRLYLIASNPKSEAQFFTAAEAFLSWEVLALWKELWNSTQGDFIANHVAVVFVSLCWKLFLCLPRCLHSFSEALTEKTLHHCLILRAEERRRTARMNTFNGTFSSCSWGGGGADFAVRPHLRVRPRDFNFINWARLYAIPRNSFPRFFFAFIFRSPTSASLFFPSLHFCNNFFSLSCSLLAVACVLLLQKLFAYHNFV